MMIRAGGWQIFCQTPPLVIPPMLASRLDLPAPADEEQVIGALKP